MSNYTMIMPRMMFKSINVKMRFCIFPNLLGKVNYDPAYGAHHYKMAPTSFKSIFFKELVINKSSRVISVYIAQFLLFSRITVKEH